MEFLKVFQTDILMVPFRSDVLECLMCRFMKVILLNKVVDDALTAYNSIKLDVGKPSHQLTIRNITDNCF